MQDAEIGETGTGVGRDRTYDLRIPALYVMALWLKGENGAADIIMAMTPAPPELIIGEAYDEARFISQLSASASQTSPGRAVPR